MKKLITIALLILTRCVFAQTKPEAEILQLSKDIFS